MTTLRPYPEYKPSGIDWLEDIPAHWSSSPLRRVASVAASNVDKHIIEGEIPVSLCNYTDVYYNRRITSDMVFSKGTVSPEELARFQLLQGDVLITKDSETWDDIAVPAVVVETLPNVVCGYHLSRIRPDPVLDGRFLAYWISSKDGAIHFKVSANGVTRFGLGANAIKSAPVPLPPLDKQRAIADFLDAMDAKITRFIAARHRMIALLEEQKQAIISQAVTRGLDPGVPLKPSGIDWLGDIPAHWDVTPLRSAFINSIVGLWGDEATDLNKKDHIRCVRVADFDIRSLGISDAKATSRAIPQHARRQRLLAQGDILLEKSGGGENQPVGRVVMFDRNEPAVTSNFISRLRVDRKRVEPTFILMLMDSMQRRRITSYSIKQTTGIQNLDERDYLSNRVALPPLEEQRVIVDHLFGDTRRVVQVTSRSLLEIELIQEYRTRLISDVVTGKLDVRGIDLPAPEKAIEVGVDLEPSGNILNGEVIGAAPVQ